jgi:hypothetical protein
MLQAEWHGSEGKVLEKPRPRSGFLRAQRGAYVRRLMGTGGEALQNIEGARAKARGPERGV